MYCKADGNSTGCVRELSVRSRENQVTVRVTESVDEITLVVGVKTRALRIKVYCGKVGQIAYHSIGPDL